MRIVIELYPSTYPRRIKQFFARQLFKFQHRKELRELDAACENLFVEGKTNMPLYDGKRTLSPDIISAMCDQESPFTADEIMKQHLTTSRDRFGNGLSGMTELSACEYKKLWQNTKK